MKVLFINNPVIRQNDPGLFAAAGPVMQPYGLLSIAGYLLDRKLAEVRLLDNNVLHWSVPELIEETVRWRPDVVGLGLYANKYRYDYELVRDLKRRLPEVICCAGGPHATLDYAAVLRDSTFDYCVIGEGEAVFGELVRQLARGREPGAIRGLACRREGKVVYGGEPELLTNLDELPFPAYDLLAGAGEQYRPAFLTNRRLPVAMVISSRGCPFACAFCGKAMPRNWRAHSPEYLLRLCADLVERQGYREIIFFDDTFAVDRQRVLEFCRLLSRRRRRFPWSASINLHTVDEEMIRAMKEAGCWLVHTGIESGDDRVLKFINKPVSVADIRRQVAMIYRHGIMLRGYFIFGLPTETRASMEKTIALACQLPLYVAVFSLYEVIPGSPLAATASTYGAISPANQFQTGRAVRDDEPPFLPDGISAAELKIMEMAAAERFYLHPRRMLMHLRRATPRSISTYGRMLRMYLQARFLHGDKAAERR